MEVKMVKRIFVEKKKGFTVEADHLKKDLIHHLDMDISHVRIINCYEVDKIDEATFEIAKANVFSEPNVDDIFQTVDGFMASDLVFRYALLPGQFDQRADSAEQCIQLMTQRERPIILCSKVLVLEGNLSDSDKIKTKKYIINPVEAHEIGFENRISLEMTVEKALPVKSYDGFIEMTQDQLITFKSKEAFAMTLKDLKHIQDYFVSENRNPTITELKAIDTYWSDHCRHTTFMTEIESVFVEENKFTKPIQRALEGYYEDRKTLYIDKEKTMCLMDLATIAAKKLKKEGLMADLDISEEINACSVELTVDVDGKDETYLIMFKNETHNHPTEIEPFGGAATCLGGAIRDPLSGRAYVYQAMRITGAGDPRVAVSETLPGKLPQRKITIGAAKGYSSYGNQIGVSTGFVQEYYHPGFLAKRMEVGAVIAASPKDEVIRTTPNPGDVVILVGGLTGRDGCGGATGSSKEHTEDSILECGSEVQKGNAPEERKLQRLFRNPQASKMIKRCNDFGAGGVSVAIGEIADSIDINLDAVLKKYEGLDGTELAISESQERMAVVVTKENFEKFIECAHAENLHAVKVAEITDSNRLRMYFSGQKVFDVSRAFLDTNGVTEKIKVHIEKVLENNSFFKPTVTTDNFKNLLEEKVSDLNNCSQKGLVEHFDGTIGSNSVLMPFGGTYYQTPTEGMVAKVPIKGNETTTATLMTHGYFPYLASWSPFHGGMYAVVQVMAKSVAMGGGHEKVRLTFQEYFEKLGQDPKKWGKPMAALLGAHEAQKAFKTAAIGGKDSMSGTFKDIHVPPTLVAFGVKALHIDHVITPELKEANHTMVLFEAKRKDDETMDFQALIGQYKIIEKLQKSKNIISAYTVSEGGLLTALLKMSFGNRIGVSLENMTLDNLVAPNIGSIVCEVTDPSKLEGDYKIIGQTTDDFQMSFGQEKVNLLEVQKLWENVLEDVFPIKEDGAGLIEKITYTKGCQIKASKTYEKPKVVIPVFPGSNCEDDTKKAFEKAGGQVELVMIRNLKAEWIESSIKALEKAISTAQILALPGGFSAGDEPDGSGKFIASVFKHPRIKASVEDLLYKRDGLMIGICNGFQALIKLGLLPTGKIQALDESSPTLTYNKIGRHVARYAQIRVASNLSPWLKNVQVEDAFQVALSHGEGRFYANEDVLKSLIEKGQIATQYINRDGNPTYDGTYNPNGSLYAIEGITSADGRILGKMGHSERVGKGLAKNIYGPQDMKIFEAGINYFKAL
jgi:phosphoribosylformylglycinamidine synthase